MTIILGILLLHYCPFQYLIVIFIYICPNFGHRPINMCRFRIQCQRNPKNLDIFVISDLTRAAMFFFKKGTFERICTDTE